jgi:hypothetical protein
MFFLTLRERAEMSMGQIPKKNKYAEKLEEDLNFTTRFGKIHSTAAVLSII